MRITLVAVLSAALGACIMFFAMRSSHLETSPVDNVPQGKAIDIDDSPFSGTTSFGEPTLEIDWSDWLSKLSGSWVSASGEQSAVLDFRMLSFDGASGWPDLDGVTFLLGAEMQFLTESGFYTVSTLYSDPDEIRLIKEDLISEDLTSLTLYRKGTARAHSRIPIPEAEPPPELQTILDGILTIKEGELKEVVLRRLGVMDLKGIEVLAGESGLGETDLLLDLGIDEHWMLHIAYTRSSPEAKESEAVLRRFQIIRGYVGEARQRWPDSGKTVFPYFAQGRVITKRQ